MLVLLLFLAVNARALVESAIRASDANQAKAAQYVYTEEHRNENLNAKGKPYNVTSEVFEVVMLEGSPYKRLIERNGKPLTEAEQQDQQTQFEDARKDRNTETAAQRKHRMAEKHFSFGLPFREIPKTFVCRLLREENGLDVIAADEAKGPWKVTMWLDKSDHSVVRMKGQVVRKGAQMEPESEVTTEWEKVNDEVWMPKRITLKYIFLAKGMSIRGEAITTLSNFKKFQVDSTVAPDTSP